MTTKPIITSLLDTDFYKFTMMQCVFHYFKDATVTYRFQCRNNIDLKALVDTVKEEAKQLCTLKLESDEIQYLNSLGFFKSDFLNYLTTFKLNFDYLDIHREDNLTINIRGPWLETILFEVPLLAIINESFTRKYAGPESHQIGQTKLREKTALINNSAYQGFRFSDFGTRRRFSKAWQLEVLLFLKEIQPQFMGTSNVFYAKDLNLRPIGTMAHEYLQACQVLAPDLKTHQAFALKKWHDEYQGQLGIALTDSLGMDTFLKEFDATLARQYQGLRHDSGSPIEWGEKAIAHYQKLGVDAKEKTFVFSDALTIPKAMAIYDHFKEKCWPAFGIGTNLMNDLGNQTLDIVIKLFQTNDKPVVKISDSPGKMVADNAEILDHIKSELNIH